jgi:SAM-dependent methyltransferase
MTSDYVGHKELILLENMINYNNSIINQFKPYTENAIKVLDFGAGIGTLSKLYFNKYNIQPDTFEIDQLQYNILSNYSYNCYNNLSQLEDESYDLIFSSNVFEHIQNDNQIFIDLFKKLKKGKYICLYLPANNRLWTDLDIKVKHFRRYDKNSIYKLILNTSNRIEQLVYLDQIGYLLTYLFKICNFKITILNKKTLNIYDKLFFKLNLFFPNYFKNKFGKNIFVSIKKL